MATETKNTITKHRTSRFGVGLLCLGMASLSLGAFSSGASAWEGSCYDYAPSPAVAGEDGDVKHVQVAAAGDGLDVRLEPDTANDRFLQQDDVIANGHAGETARREIVQQAREIPPALVQVPGDGSEQDGRGGWGRRGLRRAAGRERDSKEARRGGRHVSWRHVLRYREPGNGATRSQ